MLLTVKELYIKEGSAKGYADFNNILIKLTGYPFIFMIGARGIGKTYGAIEYIMDYNVKSIFLRRTQVQADEISVPALCPVKPNCDKRGIGYGIEKISKSVKGVKFGDAEESLMLVGALNTLHNIRGINGAQYTHMFYDEFIPEPTARPIPKEGEALLNAYETFNRNREIIGQPPIQFIGMSNSNRLDNPLFMDLNLTTMCDRAFSKGYPIVTDSKRGVAIINFEDSPISKKKGETALYKFSVGTDFHTMALENEFRDYRSPVKQYKLTKLKPIVSIGEITICRIKGEDKTFCLNHVMQAGERFANNEKDLARFYACGLAKSFWLIYLDGDMSFDSFYTESLFKRYCNNSAKMI